MDFTSFNYLSKIRKSIESIESCIESLKDGKIKEAFNASKTAFESSG